MARICLLLATWGGATVHVQFSIVRLVAHILPGVGGAGGATARMPTHRRAAEAHATVGEVSDAMRRVYGEYKETVVI